ncbi:MAG TPA: cellulase family glycosylhydrolase, partial [Acidobacteriota bacterium]|nr:cellulase family glycosylhydrolase [Acidobacteriota bacterium]
IFSGAYAEPQGAFRIERNTLAPAPGRLIAPWARSDTPGYAGGGPKFDLQQWNPEYFERLHDLMEEASRLGIVVELVLFCPFYREEQWALSPMNASNNINGIGAVERTEVYTVEGNEALLAVQKAMVRKIVEELNGYDNLYYEICNEPYFGGVTREWQQEIVRTIASTEQNLKFRHLISENVANAGEIDLMRGSGKVWSLLHPEVDILNFHYSNPPLVVALNYYLNRVIGENETGFKGTGDEYYRREAWEFILAGGALFNHLDYSFAVGFEDGTFEYPDTQPGGGSANLRRQFAILKRFIESFEFVRMRPDNTVIRDGIPREGRAHVLADAGRAYAAYIRGDAEELNLKVVLPAGSYRVEWLDPLSGETQDAGTVRLGAAPASLSAPFYHGEIALRILRSAEQ